MNQELKTLGISILGSGYLGSAIINKLAPLVKELKISSRTKNNIFKKNNIKQFILDINNLNYKNNDFFICDILIINIPSKNINSFKYLIQQIEKSTIKKVIFTSSTSIYDDTNTIIYEKDNCENKSKELYIIEQMLFNSKSFLTTSLRLSGLIGYSRHPGNFFKNNIVKNSQANVNLIHRGDCINIIIEIIKQNIWNEKFNCTATSHPIKKKFYTYASNLVNRKLKFENNPTLSYKIISNKKLINELSYTFKYPDLMKIRFN